MKRHTLLGVLAVAAALMMGACSQDQNAPVSKDEERNFRQGMNAEMVKKVGPAPTPPSGPLKGYEGGSAADKALGR